MSTDTNAAREPESTVEADVMEEQPARYVVRLSPQETNPARFRVRDRALSYATQYGLSEAAVEDSWATGDVTPDWLAVEEAKYAAREAEAERYSAEWVADLAKDVNTHLAELGITPIEPATARDGRLVPALLAHADPQRSLYSVHASFDEEEGHVLLVGDFRVYASGAFTGLKLADDRFNRAYDVLLARRQGPKRMPEPAPRPSAETQALIAVLDEIRASLDNIARNVSRP